MTDKRNQQSRYEEVQKRYQKELSLYQKQIKKTQKLFGGGRAA
jgi:hypothetical protein